MNWSSQLAEELHKPAKKKFPTRKVLSDGIDHIWSADLVDMQWNSKENDDIKYLLNVIDVFSKYAWSIPLKDKTGNSIVKAFEKILEIRRRKPTKLWVDHGTEFYNRTFRKWLNEKDIDMYSTYNEGKAVIVERFNRTLKEIMYKYFTANNTNRYIDKLDEFMNFYNNKYHRSIRMSPTKASHKMREIEVRRNLYPHLYEVSKTREAKFNVGDKVRIQKKKGTFEKGYTPRWTEEVFEIYSVHNTEPVTYKVKDWNDDQIDGSFYEQELQKTELAEVFRVEKVLKEDKKNKRVFVKWKGYPPSFNSWIPKSNLENLNSK